jgi:hypothetical protein
LHRLRLHSRAELDTWIATIEDAREELEALMKCELGVDLETLDLLERYLVGRYKSIKAALALDQRAVIDAAARIAGVTLVLAVDGARWNIDLDDPANVYYRLPVIVMPDGMQECPITMVTAALDRRTGTFLRGIVEGFAEQYASPRVRTARQPRTPKRIPAQPKPKRKPKPPATRARKR